MASLPDNGNFPDPVETDDDGVEAEPEAETVTKPFNPERIKVLSTVLVIDQLFARIQHREITAPDFQRRAGIWNPQRKSRLIESLLLRIPIPVFYFCADRDDNWTVVDGLQRTTTIHSYMSGKFPLKGLEYLTRFEGKRYAGLSRPMQRRIGETQLAVNVIQPGTPEEVTFNIFRRINTGGMPLTGQEIRHAMHKGPVLDLLQEMAESRGFLDATCRSVKPDRMADRECVLRFLAFHTRSWREYGPGDDLDTWLSHAMHAINAMTRKKRDALRATFDRTMRLACDIFGEDAFRKRYGANDRRRPVNKALFKTWSVGLAAARGRDQAQLKGRRSDLISEFHELMNQEHFEGAVSTATGTQAKVHRRFNEIQALIRRQLTC